MRFDKYLSRYYSGTNPSSPLSPPFAGTSTGRKFNGPGVEAFIVGIDYLGQG